MNAVEGAPGWGVEGETRSRDEVTKVGTAVILLSGPVTTSHTKAIKVKLPLKLK